MTTPAAPAIPPKFLQAVHDEIVGGLKNAGAHLDGARKALAFYQGDFERYPVRTTNQGEKASRFPRYSLTMQRVVNVLTGNLYKDGPKRTLPEHEAAGEWLNAVYRANNVDALWQQADRMATVTDVAAFQAVPSPDRKKPVRLVLWDASQLVVWLDPDDQTKPLVVGVLDVFNEQRRLRTWTADETRTYLTDARKPGQTAGGTAFKLSASAPNALGLIPFAFVHFDLPICDFWTGGPGTFLAEANDGLNYALTQNFDSIRYNLRPVVVGRHIREGWRPPSMDPGAMWFPPDDPDAGGETKVDASLEYLQADSSFVAASWDDFQAYFDHILEVCGVPPATVRMTQDSARSGISIVAEQLPLILWAKSRQRPFAAYEDRLAALVLAVGALHIGGQAYEELGGANYPDDAATAAELEAAAADASLTLRWPKMYPDLPGPDQDTADGWLLDNSLASKTLVVMRREGMTREEAEAYLDEVAEDLKREHALFGEADMVKAESEAAKAKLMTEATAPPEPDPEDQPEPEGKDPDEQD